MTKTVLDGRTISVARFENPNADAWIEYHMPEAWMADLAFEEIPETAARYEVQQYLSMCIHLEYVPTWDDFEACNVQFVPTTRGECDHVLDELCDGDWVAFLFPDCPESIRPYLDPEKVYQDYFHLDSCLEFPDAADRDLDYVMASRPDER